MKLLQKGGQATEMVKTVVPVDKASKRVIWVCVLLEWVTWVLHLGVCVAGQWSIYVLLVSGQSRVT